MHTPGPANLPRSQLSDATAGCSQDVLLRLTFRLPAALPSGLSGTIRCQNGAAMLPLTGQSGMEQLNLSITASGRWRAEIVVRPTDPMTIQRLTAAGFAPGPGGYVRRIDGSF